jgi:methyltransferase family protein
MERERFCNICESPNELFGTGLVLNKYEVKFFRCSSCGFIQTETPYWLEEAYSKAIASSDIGYVGRNVGMARVTRALISLAFDANKRFIDYGGGYGMFVRLMRDAGFDFYRHDLHCENLFAHGFDLENLSPEEKNKFELLTAFEVFEHLADPLSEVRKTLEFAPAIFFSTVILPEPAPPIGSWWYYVLEHGQHISFYTVRSLQILAEKFQLRLYTNRESLHLLSRTKISSAAFRLATTPKLLRLVNLIFRRESLLTKDAAEVTSL